MYPSPDVGGRFAPKWDSSPLLDPLAVAPLLPPRYNNVKSPLLRSPARVMRYDVRQKPDWRPRKDIVTGCPRAATRF